MPKFPLILPVSCLAVASSALLHAQATQTGSQTSTQTSTQSTSQTATQTTVQNPSQTPTQPAPTAPATPAPYAIPAPAPQAPGSFPSSPAYAPNPSATIQQAPTATPAPRPVIVPTPTTPQTPYAAIPAYIPYGIPDEDKPRATHDGSTYIPVDSWIYPAMSRLYSLGYADTQFLSIRPWTRLAVEHILTESEDDISSGDSDEAREILVSVRRELRAEAPADNELDQSFLGAGSRGFVYGTESVYDRAMGISGITLRDSYHLGQTIANDYGRPYQPGFNNIVGFSNIAERGRFSLYVRGEYQHAPSATGYSQGLSAALSAGDIVPFSGYNLNQATIPTGPIASQNPFRLMEATLSFHIGGHEISGGKSDAWLGPAQGGAMAWSNNAESIYNFRIDRVEPLHIPFVSRLLGPVRYEFFYGDLKGHTDPNSPYVHSEMLSFKPTTNVELTFQRTLIFGGKGHEPVTLHTFLHGFFDINDTTFAQKNSADDPGARFADFSATWRLPYLRKYATFYVDSFVHDDVISLSAPRRSAYRTGLFLSQIPGARKFDLRVEAASTDPKVGRSMNGYFFYFEGIQAQGYTNKGFIFGDNIGRQAKGGNAWLTYHLSGNESLQLSYLNKKNDEAFIMGAINPVTGAQNGPGGTTQNQVKFDLVKRFDHQNLELDAWFQYEKWKAPIYLPGPQSNTITAVQLKYYPGLRSIRN